MSNNNNKNGYYGSIDVQQPDEGGPSVPRDHNATATAAAVASPSRVRTLRCLALAVVAALAIAAVAVNRRNVVAAVEDELDLPASDTMTQRQYEKAAAATAAAKNATKPYSSIPRFYDEQLVDHFDRGNTDVWSQRYYAKRNHFKGPGHPIFLVIGGEGANNVGMFYPFIERVLAEKFGAYVLHPEHRFYGISQPLDDVNATTMELRNLLTPAQSMADMLQLAEHYRRKLGCAKHRSNVTGYCPIITAGGSYPGFLAVMMRLVYPANVDMAYGSSAPLKLYSKEASPWGYFEIITEAADRSSPGCSASVKEALTDFESIFQDAPDNFAQLAYDKLNVCPGSIPSYIDSGALFAQELLQIIETSFADANMVGNYPPSNHTWFAQLCHVFQNETAKDSLEKLTNFWLNLEVQDKTKDCFVMDYQMSEGDKATISSADWSGLGPGRDGRMWDFQCCTSLTPEMGFSHRSMFPYRKWTYKELTKHCVDRFGMVGDRYELVDKWHFDDLVGQGASRIIFTNGGNDMWMAGSYTHNLSDSIIAINMPNGGHHSEVYALPSDLPDIKAAQKQVATLLGGWLKDMKKGKH